MTHANPARKIGIPPNSAQQWTSNKLRIERHSWWGGTWDVVFIFPIFAQDFEKWTWTIRYSGRQFHAVTDVTDVTGYSVDFGDVQGCTVISAANFLSCTGSKTPKDINVPICPKPHWLAFRNQKHSDLNYSFFMFLLVMIGNPFLVFQTNWFQASLDH